MERHLYGTREDFTSLDSAIVKDGDWRAKCHQITVQHSVTVEAA